MSLGAMRNVRNEELSIVLAQNSTDQFPATERRVAEYRMEPTVGSGLGAEYLGKLQWPVERSTASEKISSACFQSLESGSSLVAGSVVTESLLDHTFDCHP